VKKSAMPATGRELGTSLRFLVLRLLVLTSILLSHASPAHPASVTLAWDPPEHPIAGYRLHYGYSSGEYIESLNVGKVTLFVVTVLEPGLDYYFAVAAYDLDGRESAFSNEIEYSVPFEEPDAARSARPVARSGFFQTREGDHVSGVLQAYDPDQDTLTFSLVKPGRKGTAVLTDDYRGLFEYFPDAGATGRDSFLFRVFDGEKSSNSARIIITIFPNEAKTQAAALAEHPPALPGTP
jgi:hypothetical protein